MSLLSKYKTFIETPEAPSLAEGAGLHYVPTLTSIHEGANIIKQLCSSQLKKKVQKTIDVVEGQHALVVEVETTIEFVSGGGAYLPGLDDNFLADRVVTFLVIHVVQFDQDRRIQQIRLHWDQGALLKSIDVIGARGKNWPIRDGQEQVHLTASSVKATPARKSADSSTRASATQPSDTNGDHQRKNPNPHASLSLFNGEHTEPETLQPTTIQMRASAKPPPREYSDLFVGNDSDASPSSATKSRSFAGGKPSEESAPLRKAVPGKNYQPSRLFDEDDSKSRTQPEPSIKTNPQKYEHFEFGEGDAPKQQSESPLKTNSKRYQHFDFGDEDKPSQQSETPTKLNTQRYQHFDFGDENQKQEQKPLPAKGKHSKHLSHWDFEDFVTPEQPAQKLRSQDVRHFGWSDDEVNLDSPVKAKKALQPRRDAETHFEFQDDGTPKEGKRAPLRPMGSSQNDGLGLYQNNVYDEDATPATSPQKQSLPLGNVTNINNHRKHFGSQFTMTDDSPSSKDKDRDAPTKKVAPVARGDNHHKATVKMTDNTWDKLDEDDEEDKQRRKEQSKMEKENLAENKRFSRGIKSNGDGMGGRAGTQRQWGFGDESGGEDEPADLKRRTNSVRNQQGTGAGGSFWDF